MLAPFNFDFDLSQWETWVVPIIGLSSAGLTLFMGGAWLRKRSKKPPPPKRIAPQRDSYDHGSRYERRSSVRRPGKQIKVYLADPESQIEPFEGWVVDRSMGGLCLSVYQAVAENTILNVRAVDAPDTVPWIQIQVKRCQSEGPRWELGCQFVRSPSWGVLLLFG